MIIPIDARIIRHRVTRPSSTHPHVPSWRPVPPSIASAGPLAFVILLLVVGDTSWGLPAAAAASAAIGLSPLLARWASSLGRWTGTFGVVSWLVVATVHALYRPLLLLVLALGAIVILPLFWRRVPPIASPGGADKLAVPAPTWPLLGAALASIVASLAEPAWSGLAAAAAAVNVAVAFPFWARSSRVFQPRAWRARFGALAFLAAITGTVLVGSALAPPSVLALSSLCVLSALVLRSSSERPFGRGITDVLLDHPARLLVFTFAGLCIVGAIGLSLPWSAADATSIGVLDAAFTAVSAACVTGLIVVDTGSAFSNLGQGFLLLVIQAGGLGIMTISTSALSLLGRRLSMRQEAVMAALVSQKNRADLFGALKRTLGVTVAFEAVGALLLTFAFVKEGDAWVSALWRGVFTSVSAFCNAGFALQPDSLVPYQANPWILHVVGVLIIAGGLSPVALVALPQALRGGRLDLQVRIALVTTCALLCSGFLIVAALEWTSSLAELSWLDRLHNAWFQSLTLRTAGFNSVDFTALRPATSTIMLAFMFIGGCPGGTAGGLKTTTAFILLLALVGSFRGQSTANVFGRTIPHQTVYKAASAGTMGVLAVLLALVMLLIGQPLPFQPALFEVVSALGTVGLSLGATSSLDEVGKIVIMVCMFLGRVGPLTVFLILSDRYAPTPWTLPEEEVEVG